MHCINCQPASSSPWCFLPLNEEPTEPPLIFVQPEMQLECRHDLFRSELPVWAELLQSRLSMLVYSGDVDGIVPVIGTRRWIAGLGLPILKPWRPWHSLTGD